MKTGLETLLFGGRWLMTPIYVGLLSALGLILVKFGQELIESWSHVGDMSSSDAILSILRLIDLSLAGNLVLMVIFAGYESFVAKISSAEHDDRPDWMGKIDFSGLKLKLIASMIAISGIHLLEVFMNLDHYSSEQINQFIFIHLTFVVSGLVLSITDFIIGRTTKHD